MDSILILVLAWVGPAVVVVTCLLTQWFYMTMACVLTYVALWGIHWPLDHWKRPFQDGLMRSLQLVHRTPSVVVSTENWKRPQIIITGPHGIFCLGVLRSILTPDHSNKRLVCATAPIMWYSCMHLIARLCGMSGNGILPLKHRHIEREMYRGHRDIAVISGGFVETNTGNVDFATMHDSKWAYWMRQCMRHGYDISFQWVYGGTQIIHTTSHCLPLRAYMGKLGIPCFVPRLRVHTDVPLVVIGFRMPVDHVPGIDIDAPAFKQTLQTFKMRVHELMQTYPPVPGIHAPVHTI